ncbi:hypothetical protein B1A99_06950 [Cohnella sp. CIP 111063]|uniref:cache domain-containing sensor histidine kinase n=1 Tax=unclassified Cohnella TaxID=2636738 RepID=UPI000B8BC7F6|nr:MULTISPECIES: sensor histidine kinase [unclassified Cohnella]OXS61242.1 hypothetical protein B1A99_06950 [Cohnella sp. CIP 111063]PRX73815.1 HAMP domain-containing protein [Cohnella sp. SGD-V74]
MPRLPFYKGKYKLRYEMILINTLIAVVPFLLAVSAFYFYYMDNVKKRVDESVDLLFSQVSGRLEEYFDSIDDLSRIAFFNHSLQRTYLEGANKSAYDWDQFMAMKERIYPFLHMNASVKDIHLLDLSAGMPLVRSYSTGAYALKPAMYDFLQGMDRRELASGRLIFSGAFVSNGETMNEYLAVRRVRAIEEGRSYLNEMFLGVLVLDRGRINEIAADIGLNDRSVMQIIDREGRVVTSTNEPFALHDQDAASEPLDGDVRRVNGIPYLIKTSPVSKVDWQLVLYIDQEHLYREEQFIKWAVPVLVALIIAAVVVAALGFNLKMTLPIKKITDALHRVAAGDFNARLRFTYSNEITAVQDHFNHMTSEVERLTSHLLNTQQQVYEMELEKKQFQLSGLRSQINAHFLYNTLQAIRGMAVNEERDRIHRLIERLADYFRYVTKDEEFVPLREELSFIRGYVDMVRLRYGRQISFRDRVPEELEHAPILKMTLQPMIENAIFHGLERTRERGRIFLVAEAHEGELRIRVGDNGSGMPKERLLALRHALYGGAAAAASDGSGIGLRNVQKRIQLYCGAEYGLTVKSWHNRGTVVVLKLPLRAGEYAAASRREQA